MDSIRSLTTGVFAVHSSPAYLPQENEDLDETDNYSGTDIISTTRKKTDFPFLLVFIFGVLILIGALGYCIANGDIDRLVVGYDKCGNVCGKVNKIAVPNCPAENMLDKPFYDVSSGKCVDVCPIGKTLIAKRCVTAGVKLSGPLEIIGRSFQACASEITALCFLALGLSFLILLVLRFCTAIFVWGVLIGAVALCASLAGTFWYFTEKSEAMTPLAIFFSICTLIMLLIILVLRRRIELVIQLLKEAGKSVIDVPLLLFEPILTFIALAVAAIAWLYFTLWIESSGTPEFNEILYHRVQFHKNGLIVFSRWYNLFIMLWMIQFIYGCQNMVIAGTVSRWYFTRNKRMLKNTICKSANDMLKYHMGTISFGSLVIALIQVLRLLMRAMRRVFRRLLCLCCLCCVYTYIEECLNNIETFVKYFTRNVYIVTAIHGTDFMESGTKALRLLVDNVLRVMVINSVGDFVLVAAKCLIVLGSVLLGVLMMKDNEHVDYIWVVLIFVGVIAYVIAHCFITVYEMAVDTIFICFCEDCEINDGMARPYYMSHTLMEFVEKSKTVLNVKVEDNVVNSAT